MNLHHPLHQQWGTFLYIINMEVELLTILTSIDAIFYLELREDGV